MIQLAFKDAEKSGGAFARAIQHVTGGKFSHVELWLSGTQKEAFCYSSREPEGTGHKTIDLTDLELWTIVPLPIEPHLEPFAMWYSLGSSGRPYDFAGILGIGTDTKAHTDFARFCSEECFELIKKITGWWPGIERWHVAPSGFQQRGDRYGLYELATVLSPVSH